MIVSTCGIRLTWPRKLFRSFEFMGSIDLVSSYEEKSRLCIHD